MGRNKKYMQGIKSCTKYEYRFHCNTASGYVERFTLCNAYFGRSQWPRGLRRRSAAARLLRLWVRNPLGGKDVCRVYCVLSRRGLGDELITRPEESYRLSCVIVCNLETSWMWRPLPTGGCRAKKKKCIFWYSRPEFLNAQRVQHCWQWGQTVTQWHINPRVVQGEHEAHFLACCQTTQCDGVTSFAVVHTLGYQVVTLQKNDTVTI